MMKRTSSITQTALVAAITFIILALASLIPTAALSLAALAGFLPAMLVLKCGYASAFSAYLLAGFLGVILLPDKSCTVLFVLLFGYYSVIKQWAERSVPPLIAWVYKLIFANIVFFLLFFFFTHIFLAVVPRVLTVFWITWLVYLVVFVIYDCAAGAWLAFCSRRILK